MIYGGQVTATGITAIRESAFEGAAMTVAYIPDGCVTIDSYAFRSCTGLTQIRIPADCLLGENVFDGCTKVYVYSAAGSPAEAYCQSHANCVFVAQ